MSEPSDRLIFSPSSLLSCQFLTFMFQFILPSVPSFPAISDISFLRSPSSPFLERRPLMKERFQEIFNFPDDWRGSLSVVSFFDQTISSRFRVP